MRLETRMFLLLLGVGAVIIGGQWYLTAAQTSDPTNFDAFISSMKSVSIASVVLVAGMWVAIKASGPGHST